MFSRVSQRRFAVALLAAIGPLPWFSASWAQELAPSPAPPEAVYVVVHVDILPKSVEAALPLLREHEAANRHAPGAKRFEILREPTRPNHFTLVEVWASESARQTNEASDETRHYRTQLQPLLASPFDERLHHLEQP